MAKVKYQTIDTRTVEGITKAEKLLNEDWKIGAVGFTTIQLWKKEEK
jgi:hypothetical protein